jgi:hypothetical protein
LGEEKKRINQIFDKIFKKTITLSSGAVINLINSLFDENYPKESIVSYNWTESVDGELRRRLADAIVTVTEPLYADDGEDGKRKVNSHRYHMEAEIDRDDEIIFRMFDYGYRNALDNVHGSNSDSSYVLSFPEPKIIYIYSSRPVPDEYELTLDFGKQGNFRYKVQTVKLHMMSIKELNERKMIILIPFKLLELRDAIKKDRSRTNIAALQSLIFNDIIGSIRKNVEVGNITRADGHMLINMTKYLYDYLYSHYKELREVTEMTDGSILLEVERVELEYEEKLKKADEDLVLEVERVGLEYEKKLKKADENCAREVERVGLEYEKNLHENDKKLKRVELEYEEKLKKADEDLVLEVERVGLEYEKKLRENDMKLRKVGLEYEEKLKKADENCVREVERVGLEYEEKLKKADENRVREVERVGLEYEERLAEKDKEIQRLTALLAETKA